MDIVQHALLLKFLIGNHPMKSWIFMWQCRWNAGCESFVISPHKLLVLTYPVREPICAQQRLAKHMNTVKRTREVSLPAKKGWSTSICEKKKLSTAGIDNAKENTRDFNLRHRSRSVFIQKITIRGYFRFGFGQVWVRAAAILGKDDLTLGGNLRNKTLLVYIFIRGDDEREKSC